MWVWCLSGWGGGSPAPGRLGAQSWPFSSLAQQQVLARPRGWSAHSTQR